MLSSTLCVVLFAAVLVSADESLTDKLVEPRLGASGIRIARLERDIAALKAKVEEAGKVDPSGFITEINARLDNARKTKVCEGTDLQCGRDSVECVSPLLLCDGKSDCHNGWDEDTDTCTADGIKAGNVFTGFAAWHSCRNRKDHPVTITLVDVLKPKFFGAQLVVRGKVGVDFAEDDEDLYTYDVTGYYKFGKKKLILTPVDTTKGDLGVVCKFTFGDGERATCTLAHEATLTKCADLRINLQQ
jgi:hypothetical protein